MHLGVPVRPNEFLRPLQRGHLADPVREAREAGSVALDGDTAVVGAPRREGNEFGNTFDSGVVYVFIRLPCALVKCTARPDEPLGFAPHTVHFSATAVEMVRGVLATCHVFLRQELTEKAVWQVYRQAYGREPFIRIVKARDGVHRYPEPKLVAGTNFCDIGFERDPSSNRLVVVSAIDNLVKGAAGQAVQAFNVMHGLPETTGLEFAGLHPV